MATKRIQDTSSTDASADYDTGKYSGIDPDSNRQATEVVAPAGKLVQLLGGADDQTDTGQSGGRELL
jgi:hypothetical protein